MMIPICETPEDVLTIKEALDDVAEFFKTLDDGQYMLSVTINDFQDRFQLSRAVVKK